MKHLFYPVALFFTGIYLPLLAVETQVDTGKWYTPNHLRVQYAGNIGAISAGPSWLTAKDKLELSISMGYVPPMEEGKTIYIAALKGIYKPQVEVKVRNLAIRPLALGLVSSYTFGDQYNKYWNNNRYPKGYYPWNPGWRTAILYEAEIYTAFDKGIFKGLSFFSEVTFWDLYVVSKFGNHNYSRLSFRDIMTLGVGFKSFLAARK